MDKLKIAVCEDSPEESRRLVSLAENTGIPCRCDLFSSGEDFLAAYQKGNYDAVFMDIYMGGISGVETVKAIRGAGDDVPVAFATTSTEFALEGYRLDVIKYIEKPVGQKAVKELMELAVLKRDNRPRLTLRVGGEDVGVALNRVMFAEQKGHDVLVYLAGGEVVQTGERLDSIEPRFGGGAFFRCHKSYIVNLSYVETLDRELMVFAMRGGQNVHIRRESLGAARKAYEAYLYSRTRGQDDE